MRKALVYMLACGVTVALLAGCGKKENIVALKVNLDYGKLYAEAIKNELGVEGEKFLFKLIYINDDDIPELYYAGDCEASGSGVFYINPAGEAQLVMMSRIGGAYEPKSNLYYHCQGHMGYYYDQFYGFVDGEFTYLEGGEYTEDNDNIVIGDDGERVPDIGEVYYNGEEVSYEKYCDRIDEMLKGHTMIDLNEWEFTKDGEPISDDEYWEHWGEDGYYGGPKLLSYTEIMKELGESDGISVLSLSSKYDYALSNEITIDVAVPDSSADLFRDFLLGVRTAQIEEDEYYSIDGMIDDEIDNYYDKDVLLGEINSGAATWEERLNVSYMAMETAQGSVLFIDSFVMDPAMANGHTLYRLVINDGELVVKDKLELGWSDWETFYKSGIVEINHGMHMPEIRTFLDAGGNGKLFMAAMDVATKDKALLIVAGPSSWASENDYKNQAEKVIIWDDGEDVSNEINSYLGVDLSADEITPMKLIGV